MVTHVQRGDDARTKQLATRISEENHSQMMLCKSGAREFTDSLLKRHHKIPSASISVRGGFFN